MVLLVAFATIIPVNSIMVPLMKRPSPWQLHVLHNLLHHSHLLVVGSRPPKSKPELLEKKSLLALLEVCNLQISLSFLTKFQSKNQQVDWKNGRNLTSQKFRSPILYSSRLGKKLTRICRELNLALSTEAITSRSPHFLSTCQLQSKRRLTSLTGSLLVHCGSIKLMFACLQSSQALRCGGISSIPSTWTSSDLQPRVGQQNWQFRTYWETILFNLLRVWHRPWKQLLGRECRFAVVILDPYLIDTLCRFKLHPSLIHLSDSCIPFYGNCMNLIFVMNSMPSIRPSSPIYGLHLMK